MNKNPNEALIAGAKRANKALKRRDPALTEREDYERRKLDNKKLIETYTQELHDLAESNGLREAVERAAEWLGGTVESAMRFHVHQGFSTACLDPSLVAPEIGELRASFLSYKIVWPDGEQQKRIELKLDTRGWINFHNQMISTPPFIWQRNMPTSLDERITKALERADIVAE